MKITSKNQLTLPRAVREALGVGCGDFVDFEVDNGKVTLVPAFPEDRFRKWAGRFRVGRGLSAKEIDVWLREVRGRDE